MHHHHQQFHNPGRTRRDRNDFGFFGINGPGPFFGGRGGRGGSGGGRVPRGNVRAAILALLAERPMHGYEIISELEARTDGIWRPSPGSVYPTLQLLEDEGLLRSVEDGGKRQFQLTDDGREQAAQRGDGPAPWEEVTAALDPSTSGLRESGALLLSALVQVGRAGSNEQRTEAKHIIDDARRRLYGLLADTPGE